MKTEPTSVLNGRFPEINTTEPNSPSTSTQAISVPATAFTTATASAISSVSSSAATASRELTACQKPEKPCFVDCATTAASGSSTITLSQATDAPSSSGGRLIDA